jgi:hypothetical protein
MPKIKDAFDDQKGKPAWLQAAYKNLNVPEVSSNDLGREAVCAVCRRLEKGCWCPILRERIQMPKDQSCDKFKP